MNTVSKDEESCMKERVLIMLGQKVTPKGGDTAFPGSWGSNAPDVNGGNGLPSRLKSAAFIQSGATASGLRGHVGSAVCHRSKHALGVNRHCEYDGNRRVRFSVCQGLTTEAFRVERTAEVSSATVPEELCPTKALYGGTMCFRLVLISGFLSVMAMDNRQTAFMFEVVQTIQRLARGAWFLQLLHMNMEKESGDWLGHLSHGVATMECSNILTSLRTCGKVMDGDFQKALGKAVLACHIPIARRMGLTSVAQQLEECALELVDPLGFRRVKELVDMAHHDGHLLVQRTRSSLEQLAKELPVRVTVTGRVKSASSVYFKMKEKRLTFSEVHDFLAVRMIIGNRADGVTSPDLCDHTLRLIRESFGTVDVYSKDYIRFPKPNGYRGLHTAVNLGGRNLAEVQIRTADMHEHAENGNAAHWQYKTSKNLLFV